MSNYTLWGLFGPATWPWWGLAAGLAVRLLRPRQRRLSDALLGAGVASFVLLALLPTGYWLMDRLEQRFPPPDNLPDDVRHIVVLAGAERLPAAARTGRPQYSSAAERVIEGAVLARRFPRADVWILGGVRDPRSPLADIDWTAITWRELGVPVARIRKIDHTLDTCRNAEGFAARQAQGTALLVTSAFHMPRSVACFRAYGVRVIPYPVDYQNEPSRGWRDLFGTNLSANMTRSDTALHEWIGLGYYRLQGRTKDLFPAR